MVTTQQMPGFPWKSDPVVPLDSGSGKRDRGDRALARFYGGRLSARMGDPGLCSWCFCLFKPGELVSKANAANRVSLGGCLRGPGSCTHTSDRESEKRREVATIYLVLRGSRLLLCHLRVREARETLERHPRPSCHPAQALLCTLRGGSQWQRQKPQDTRSGNCAEATGRRWAPFWLGCVRAFHPPGCVRLRLYCLRWAGD